MQLKIKNSILQDFAKATTYEWLETNGLGGWSSSSVTGAHTRRYHGLLVAATKIPAERTVLLSKLDETIVTGNTRTELGCNLYQGDIIHPKGHQYLKSFRRKLFPEWVYLVNDIKLKKTVVMIYNENTVIISYQAIKAPSPFTLELLPLMAARGYHALQQAGPQMHWDADFTNGVFHNIPDGNSNVYISVPGAAYMHMPRWFYHFNYAEEASRGLDFAEDLFNHGVISVEMKEGDSLHIIVSTENPQGRDAKELVLREEKRKKELVKNIPADETLQQLVIAADQFIVRRTLYNSSAIGEGWEGATVIAGYHWFTDWGRDTMISLPGLTLCTNRFEDAKKIITAFSKYVNRGMLPNCFPDGDKPPAYNTADATLWYFIAVYKYLQTTNDKAFILNEILPVLKEIIDWHYKGTRYNIQVDKDGLLYSGEIGEQLTWMDAKVGNWVVTPRMGKPVEIQALWYNALKIFAELLSLHGQKQEAIQINESADYVKQKFNEKFWNEKNGYLYDTIDEYGKYDDALRPNQLFALSLPFALIDDKKKIKSILKIITDALYTPVGLRSLSPSNLNYVHRYVGDQWHRDAAYHQGTVWSWLLGAYADAIMKNNPRKGRQKVKKMAEAFNYHLNEAGIGTVSEIFDGDAPHHPRGCIAQAWGVAELLRIIKEYKLYKEG